MIECQIFYQILDYIKTKIKYWNSTPASQKTKQSNFEEEYVLVKLI